MDIDGDGHPDILSGSYSRQDRDMAGLFQVLRGGEKGFSKPAVLKGTDGEPLIIPASEEDMIDKICTRPSAADLDGDGDLDLVVGNFAGTFFLFEGKGKGAFEPKPRRIDTAEGEALRVPQHGDPFPIDWDGDGDLDLLSGSSQGGVFLALNEGSKKQPRFAQMKPLIPPAPLEGDSIVFGEKHLAGPSGSTRVWADDVNGDGKLDLIVGDMATIYAPGEGLDEETARKKHAEHMKKLASITQGDSEDGTITFDNDAFGAWIAEGERLVKQEMTGFVWLYLRR